MISIGYAIAHEFGESGRRNFMVLCSQFHGYSESYIDGRFNHCLKGNRGDATIGTVYHQAKQHGLEWYSDESKQIIRKVAQAKRRGLYKSIDDYWH